jgi:6-phosphogluconolactonase
MKSNERKRLSLLPMTMFTAFTSGITMAVEAPLVFVSGSGPDIICYALESVAGSLSEISRSPGGINPSYLAWSPNRKYLYAVNESDMGKVVSFSIASSNGALSKLTEGSSGGSGPCFVGVHPNGKWVFAANYGSGHVAVLPVQADGGVSNPVDVQLAGKNAHMAITDASGKWLFVPCLGSDYVMVYGLDEVSGKLKEVSTVAVAKGAGPRHLAFSSDEKFMYVLNELNSTLSAFACDLTAPSFRDIGTVSTLPADFTGKNKCAHLAIAPDGKTLYASNRGHNSVAIYRVDTASGKLTLAGHETAGSEINVPRDFTLTAAGTLALVASQKSDLVSIMRIDPATGLMSKIGTQKVGKGPSFVGGMTR